MNDMYEILRENLVKLRKENNLTQSELAGILKYSDKSVSKWETGETLPPLETLLKISDYYGISVDDLLRKPLTIKKDENVERIKKANKKVISILVISIAWLMATTIFVGSIITGVEYASSAWIAFVWAVPLSFLVLIFLSSFWFRKEVALFVSLFVWTLLASVFITITVISDNTNYYLLFLIGVPVQIIIVLCKKIYEPVKKEYYSNLEDKNEEKTE